MYQPIKIFLVHASEDKEPVLQIHHRLKSLGFKPWIDKLELLPGQNWREQIPKDIRTSDFAIVFLSTHSVSKRGYVQKEFKLALDVLDEMPEERLFVLPVRLDNCKVPEKFRDLHYVDLFEEGGFESLVASIMRNVQFVLRYRFPFYQISLTAKMISELRRNPDHVNLLSSGLFKEFVGEMLASLGWRVGFLPLRMYGRYRLFGISTDRAEWLIHCKRFRSGRKVGRPIVEECYEKTGRLQNLMVVTTSCFTRCAREFAEQHSDVELRDFEDILGWIRDYRANKNRHLYLESALMVGDDLQSRA